MINESIVYNNRESCQIQCKVYRIVNLTELTLFTRATKVMNQQDSYSLVFIVLLQFWNGKAECFVSAVKQIIINNGLYQLPCCTDKRTPLKH